MGSRLERVAIKAEARHNLRATLACAEAIARVDEALLKREEANRPPGSRSFDKETRLQKLFELLGKVMVISVGIKEKVRVMLTAADAASEPRTPEPVIARAEGKVPCLDGGGGPPSLSE